MEKPSKGLLFRSVNKTPVIPVKIKIIVVFILFIITSNFATNWINLNYNRVHNIQLMKRILAKDLKDFISYANTQYEIAQFNDDFNTAYDNIAQKALYELRDKTGKINESTGERVKPKSFLMILTPEGEISLFSSPGTEKWSSFDSEMLNQMNTNLAKGVDQDFVNVKNGSYEYFGVYNYSYKYKAFFFRAEEFKEFHKESNRTFLIITIIILVSTVIMTIVGILIIGYLLRFIGIITDAIMEMVKTQQMGLIPLHKAPNDDITYLGMAFNSLSSTIENLLQIFKKFTNQDIAYKAYKERDIRLEGQQKELTILFSDIKGFTTITETLGTDIIKLINLHYDRAIREIIRYDGTIGSIIGDAILAMFGTMEEISDRNKSLAAVYSAYELHAVAEHLRLEMTQKKEAIIRSKGGLTAEEEKVYSAVMLEIGCGIDGGDVFYGNIGSYVRMTNTVIGDNVNAASRLEGLTRVYKVPVICSEFVKNDIETNTSGDGITFLEIDTVQVKGKTIGRKVYWPILEQYMTKALEKDLKIFEAALQKYYDGTWSTALREFKKVNLPLAEVFIERISRKKAPRNWKGIWAMQSK